PYQIVTVIAPIIDQLALEKTIVVSIAAGWDLNKFRDLIGTSFEQAHIQCTIPITPMAVGKGVQVTEIDNTL
ncbi:pyrroline-5-carboxylate reductase, partial [Bifidobacterium pseudocatenulatum]|nr:pyrroline-5-carboxylate reductase [Bifidobacterium pseudocatenulatum]